MSFAESLRVRVIESRHARLISDLAGYFGASALALLLDFATLTLLFKGFGVDHLVAAAAGFLSGLGLIYWLSVRFIFEDRRRLGVRAEIIGFILTGLAGLAITEALMHLLVDYAGLPVLFAKIPTSGLVFVFNFTVRRMLIFSQSPSGDRAR